MTPEGPGLGSVAGGGIQCTASRCGSPAALVSGLNRLPFFRDWDSPAC